jgi:hypothetical protein
MAGRILLPHMGDHAAAIPFYFLSGFAVELALKAVVLRVNGDQRELFRIGHDLNAARVAAEACGMAPLDPDLFQMVKRLSPSHADLVFRYIPNVECMEIIGPRLLDSLLERLIVGIEAEIDVWEDQPFERPRLRPAPPHAVDEDPQVG